VIYATRLNGFQGTADFREANFRGADFGGAGFQDANFWKDRVKFRSIRKAPVGFEPTIFAL
jgi:uncharacterized protein YjbI with pentapeptide repeats